MAVLSKNGTELLRWKDLTYEVSYRSNRWVLRKNVGGTWKQWKKLKDSVDLEEFSERKLGKIEEFIRTRPNWVAYRELLRRVASDQAAFVHNVMMALGDDVDGAWAELDDFFHGRFSFGDCQELSRAMAALMAENRMLREVREAIGGAA